MLVSVIIPTYNCGAYLADAIRSVLTQTGGVLEIIVVDDGSTDDTSIVIQPWLDRLRYIRTPNRGVASARNTGVAQATGEFVAFLDADDAWYPDKLDIQLRALHDRPAVGAVCADFGLTDERGVLKSASYVKQKYRVFAAHGLDWPQIFTDFTRLAGRAGGNAAESVTVYYGDAFRALFLGNFINTSSIVLRRDVLEAVGSFTEGRRTQEDYEFWLKVALRRPIAYVDKPLLFFRRRSSQLTSADQNIQIAEDTFDVVAGVADAARGRLDDRLVARRLVDRLQALALARLGTGQAQDARRALAQAYHLRGLDWMIGGLWLWSLLPRAVQNRAQRVYRVARSRYDAGRARTAGGG